MTTTTTTTANNYYQQLPPLIPTTTATNNYCIPTLPPSTMMNSCYRRCCQIDRWQQTKNPIDSDDNDDESEVMTMIALGWCWCKFAALSLLTHLPSLSFYSLFISHSFTFSHFICHSFTFPLDPTQQRALGDYDDSVEMMLRWCPSLSSSLSMLTHLPSLSTLLNREPLHRQMVR